MKMKREKLKVWKYFFEFVVVFTGVFLAFLLNAYQERRAEERKESEIYTAVYEELNSFYQSGRKENKSGFIRFFKDLDQRSDSLIALKKLPVKTTLFGDYWKIPIIKSFVENGMLKDIDIDTYKKIARFNTVHENFLNNIKEYNAFYDKYITAEYDMGMDHFFVQGTKKLKPKYSYLNDALLGISEFAELLVDVSQELSSEIQTKHL